MLARETHMHQLIPLFLYCVEHTVQRQSVSQVIATDFNLMFVAVSSDLSV